MNSYVRVVRLGEKVVTISIPEPLSLKEILDKSGIPIDKLRMDIRVNGKEVEDTFKVKPGDMVTILPPIRGG